ncbi:lipoate--protein ligase family protein [Tenuibacillus multivorans]|uniref:Lipoate-protein ligase A n=1 Tax=Tenuibacillus multivorans TaxID=237069 RepID=A0A1G9WWE7_9BACI|nr:biotin/lipoate A/B protein ligase family protein [Tenuibacillus multivorans]GEL78406.1 octanoyltransferase LipM [Tenuibacillus multivorans]SDM88581.1 lipoate-protein ligase A [Tenuibacillus multivorans]
MTKETWYFINTGSHDAAYNMAFDECLLHWHSKGQIPPVLRFYTWDPATMSVGYFQKVDGKIHIDNVEKHGFGFVRRLTGGRAVLHDHELTYSVVVSEDHPKMPKTVTEAYRVITKGLLEGYRNLNIDAEMAVPEGKLNNTGSAVCFDEPSWYELVIDGKKAAGSAQTRKQGVILQHGSVPISMDNDQLFDLFVYPSDNVRQRVKTKFADKATTMEAYLGRNLTLDEVEEAFYHGFEKGLDIQLKPYELTAEEEQEVISLAKEKYQSDDWNFSKGKKGSH